MSKKKGKIFIQIAAYRDPELVKTIKDCLEKAKKPQNLIFSICWQHDETENLDEFKNDKRFKIIDIDYRKSQGVCWARNLLQKQYDQEEYTLQLDSHHRFVQDWDSELINIFEGLKKNGCKKPLLTGYLPSFNPENDPKERVNEPWQLDFDRFLPQGICFLKPSIIENISSINSPVPARFYGAHFAFASGDFVKEVPHDPDLYFLGEETTISARAFTWGYDLFHLHKVLIWHEYGREKKKRQWDDVEEWFSRDEASHGKIRKLLRIDNEVNDIDFGPYGFGPIRSIEEYEKYAGLDFKNRRVQKHTYDLKIGPPEYKDEASWEANWIHKFKFCIDVHKNYFKANDYDCWAIAFKDIEGQEIARIDAGEEEIQNLLKKCESEGGWIRLWREFDYDKLPYSYVIWPHSKTHGWIEKIENKIPSPIPQKTKTEDPKSLWPEFGKRKLKPFKFNKNPDKRKIFIHLPAYREPELIPTIKDAILNAKNAERLVFGICRQFNPEDKFDNIDEFRSDNRFKIIDMPYEQAKGLAFARYQINTMLENEEYLLQLDSHHRFAKNWDSTLIEMHDGLKKKGFKKPILGGYLPMYDPKNDPEARVMEPWQSICQCFYPHGTIFIRPMSFINKEILTEPIPARFLSGHFSFADNHWGKTIKHDIDIYFSGEEINLTVRSFTHGYDIFHPHKVVIWHGLMREERDGILIWDDQHKRGEHIWSKVQDDARAKIRQLLQVEYNGYDLTGYNLGTERSLHDYERFAGICFKNRSIQEYTANHGIPPNPPMPDCEWEKSLKYSFYHLVDIGPEMFPSKDYEHILISFDDKDGIGVNHKYIHGDDLKDFLDGKARIHYEEYFICNRKPVKAVYWPYSSIRGWVDKIEINLK